MQAGNACAGIKAACKPAGAFLIRGSRQRKGKHENGLKRSAEGAERGAENDKGKILCF